MYPAGSPRGQRGVGAGCWPGVAPPSATPLRCYDEPVAAAVQSFTAWRQNLLAISAAAAAAGATSGVYHGRGLEHHRLPPASAVIDGPLSIHFDHCRLPTALMMSHQDGSDINNTGLSSRSVAGITRLAASVCVCVCVCVSVILCVCLFVFILCIIMT